MNVSSKILIPIAAGVGTVVISLAGAAYHKISKMAKKFDRSVSELDEITVKDIQKTVVKEAVDRAAKTEVSGYLRDAHDEVFKEAKSDLHSVVAVAVGEARKMISDKTEATITEEVAKINISELRQEVRTKAEEKVLAKFDDNLQDILDKFSGNLSSVRQIYSSIAETVRHTTSRDDDGKVTFKLG